MLFAPSTALRCLYHIMTIAGHCNKISISAKNAPFSRFNILMTHFTRMHQIRSPNFSQTPAPLLARLASHSACPHFSPWRLLWRREQCGSLFGQIACDESRVLHCLLPTKGDYLTDRLRSAKTYPMSHVTTTRLQNSFIPFALTNLQ